MCGVNGVFAYRDAAPRAVRGRVAGGARGDGARADPTAPGLWWSEDRRCGLGHRRLAIIDPTDRAAQPMTSADGRLAISYNGEIYNFPQLKAQLEARGARFRTTSDTEALLHLYALDGAQMVRSLRGMFALAIWDETRQGLFLARDPYGIKPLYVCDDGRSFRFASQVKALLAGGTVSREPEPAGLAGFHLLGHVPEPFTLYRDIRALPAGCTQWIDAAGAQPPRPYVSIPAILAEGVAEPAPAPELGERVRAAVAGSVAAHMLADVEVGAFLSAGVDSGALLGLMRDAGGVDVRAITLAFTEFQGTPEDEAPLAALVAERYGARHEIRRVGRAEFEADLPAIFAAMDQPSIDGVNTWFVAKAAKEAGLKVAISGLGGDELLAGYPSFVDLPRWRRRFGALAGIPGVGVLSRSMLQTLAPGMLRERPKAAGMLEFAGSWPGVYLLRRALFLPHELPALIGPDLAREGLRRLDLFARIGAGARPGSGQRRRPGLCAGIRQLHAQPVAARRRLGRDGARRRDQDPAGGYRACCAPRPYLPRLRPGEGKAALAAAPSIPLPAEVVSRAKTGFSVPTGAWMAAAAVGSDRGPRLKGLASRR